MIESLIKLKSEDPRIHILNKDKQFEGIVWEIGFLVVLISCMV